MAETAPGVSLLDGVKRFNAGVFAMHPLWQGWILAIVVVNGVWPLLFVPDLAAIVVLAGFYSGALIGMYLAAVAGFTKLLAVMHGPWIPMVVAIGLLHPGFETMDHYTCWITASLAISIGSLVIDFADAIQYMRTATPPSEA